MAAPPSQKPRASRFQAGTPAVIDLDGIEVPCTATDLSRSGTLLQGAIPQIEDPEVSIRLRSGSGDLELKLACRIVRDAMLEDGQHQLGVEFLEVHESDRPTLEAMIARVVEGVSPAALDNLPPNATPQQIRAALESIPLPHRIQLASRGLPRERELLIHDPNAQVLDALARNPGVLLHEVLALLRSATALPATIEQLAKDPRWSSHEQLRVLMASHRNVPLPVALRLIDGMPLPALQRLIQASGLKPALRERVLRKLPGGRRP